MTNHGGGEDRVGGHNVSLQTPGDGQRLVTSRHHTDQLGELSLVNDLSSKGEWNNVRFLCN